MDIYLLFLKNFDLQLLVKISSFTIILSDNQFRTRLHREISFDRTRLSFDVYSSTDAYEIEEKRKL